MERESCDYNIAMGRALGMDKPLTTIYFEKWYDILPKIKMPSVTDKEARHTYEQKMTTQSDIMTSLGLAMALLEIW